MLRDQAVYLAYATGWSAVRRMPERSAYALFDRIADQQWRSRGSGVRRLEANLARVLGPVPPQQLREASREGVRSYMRYWCDAFRLPGWDAGRIDSFDLRGLDQAAADLDSGRGVVLALPHAGNWDHAGAMVSARVAPVTTVAERLEPERLYEAFVGFRTSLGMRILGLGDDGVYEQLAHAASGGGLVALLADRDLSARGVDVTFFGERARFPAGPAALAVDTGAAVRPTVLFRDGDVNAGQVGPPVEVPTEGDRRSRIAAVTQAIATAFEAGLAAHPTDWHMLQRLWLADLDPARLAARDAEGA